MSEFSAIRFVRPAAIIFIAISSLQFAHAGSRSMDTYRSIIDRNPFQLRSPKVPEKIVPPPAPKPPEPEFFLTGITTVGYPRSPKRAYLVKKDSDPKHSTTFLTLSLGDRNSDPRLIDVDAKGRRVKINFHGEDIWLSMKQNAMPSASTLAPAFARNISARFPTPRLN